MPEIDIQRASTQLSKLVKAVETGVENEFVITREGRPAVRLVALEQPLPKKKTTP